jgi:hypothetical protein
MKNAAPVSCRAAFFYGRVICKCTTGTLLSFVIGTHIMMINSNCAHLDIHDHLIAM